MKLIDYIPSFLQGIREFKEIFNVEDIELDNIKIEVDKLLKEVIVKTATSYGLERYEKIYRIDKIASTLEARRMNILFKMNNRVPYTLKWLINTLNEAVGEENYKLTTQFDLYKIYIEINLNYTEAAEILKADLIKQIPANIELDYRLFAILGESICASISQQTYMNLDTVAINEIDNITVKQNNKTGLNVNRQDYIELDINNDLIVEKHDINLNSKNGLQISSQDYILIEEVK